MTRLALTLLIATSTWAGTWTGTPTLTLGTNTPTCCSQTTNNYTQTRLTITLHRTGAGYHIYSTGTLNGPSPSPGYIVPFIYASTNATLVSATTTQAICTGGTLIAGGDWPWGTVQTNGPVQAYARLRFPGCPLFNKWTVIQLQNATSAIAVVR